MPRQPCPCCHMSELEARRRLSEAAYRGNTEECRRLIKKHWNGGPLPDMDDETIQALAERYHGSKLKEQLFWLQYPVFTAVEQKKEETALFLLSDATDPEEVLELEDFYGRPLMHRAAKFGMSAMVRALTALGCDVAQVDGDKGHTALCKAARSGSVETFTLIMDLFRVSGRCMGGFVNQCPVKSLLMHAVKGDNPVPMLEFMVKELGMDLDEPLETRNPNFKLHHYAAQEWRPKALRWLIQEAGMSVEARADRTCSSAGCTSCRDYHSFTPLHCAANDHDSRRDDAVLETIRLLVEECGADRDARTRKGKTAAQLTTREDVRDFLLAEQKAKEADAAAAALLAELEAEEAREERKKAKKSKGKKKGKGAGGQEAAAPAPASAAAAVATATTTTDSLAARVAAVRLEEEKGEGGGGDGGSSSKVGEDGDVIPTLDDDDEDDDDEEAAAKAEPPRPLEPEPEPEVEEPEEARPFTDEEEAYMLDGAPDHMICPLTRTLVYDPRIASDGFTYQKRAIERYIKEFKARGEKLVSPMTGEPLADVTIPNHLVRQTVLKWIDQKKRELRTVRYG